MRCWSPRAPSLNCFYEQRRNAATGTVPCLRDMSDTSLGFVRRWRPVGTACWVSSVQKIPNGPSPPATTVWPAPSKPLPLPVLHLFAQPTRQLPAIASLDATQIATVTRHRGAESQLVRL